jgi:molecular chaperone DnaK
VAIKDLEDAIKGDDKARIESRTAALEQAAQSLAAAAAAAGHGPGPGPGGDAGGGQSSGARADDVVDAEFTEVKDRKDG